MKYDQQLLIVDFASLQAIRKCLRAINESRAQKRKVMHLSLIMCSICEFFPHCKSPT